MDGEKLDVANRVEVPFTKYQALGNDFIVVQEMYLPRRLTEFARAITNRRLGVGADGLLAVLEAERKGDDARVQFFNADGSEAEMSGNGIRCVGAFMSEQKAGNRPLRIETLSGVKTLERVATRGIGKDAKWVFRVGMGAPVFSPKRIPFRAGDHPVPVVAFPLPTHRGTLPVTVTSMGNPHCSLIMPDFDSVDWERLGREIERHALFPNRTNVEFIKPLSKREIEVRFWERGVGETMASGTGSCAAAVASVLNGLTGRNVRVRTQLGALEVAWPEKGEVTLTGPVERVAEGVFHYRVQGAGAKLVRRRNKSAW